MCNSNDRSFTASIFPIHPLFQDTSTHDKREDVVGKRKYDMQKSPSSSKWKPQLVHAGDRVSLDLDGVPPTTVMILIKKGGEEASIPKITYINGICLIFMTTKTDLLNAEVRCIEKGATTGVTIHDQQERVWKRLPSGDRSSEVKIGDVVRGTMTVQKLQGYQDASIILNSEEGRWILLTDDIVESIERAVQARSAALTIE
jgi:hypothetical protein